MTNTTELTPTKVQELLNQGITLINEGRLKEAHKLSMALTKAQGKPEALIKEIKSNAYVLAGMIQEKLYISENALELYEEALKLDPENVKAMERMRPIYCKFLMKEKAEEIARKLYSFEPDSANVIYGLGTTLDFCGKKEEAIEVLTKNLEINPDHILTFRELTKHLDFSDDDSLVLRFQKLLDDDTVPNSDRALIQLLLARLKMKQHKYQDAYKLYISSNKLTQAERKYDVDMFSKVTLAEMRIFTKETSINTTQTGNDSIKPVFIFGQSTSGKSLLESLLSSSSSLIHGSGELNVIQLLRKKFASQLGPPPHSLQNVNSELLNTLAQTYLKRQVKYADEGCLFATDTMPTNVWDLGFIQMLFPSAPMIHITRDPFDTCFNMFIKSYLSSNEWSYDIRSLAHYYLHYRQIMEHWDKVLPPGRYLELSYENLVTDPSKELTRIAESLSVKLDLDAISDRMADINTENIGIARNFPEFCKELKQHMLSFRDIPSLEGLSFFNELEKLKTS